MKGDGRMKRFLKILAVSALVFSLVVTSLFLIVHSDHKCESHSCPICHGMESAFNILRGLLALSLSVFCFALSFRRMSEGASLTERGCFTQTTPILLKVKLNN